MNRTDMKDYMYHATLGWLSPQAALLFLNANYNTQPITTAATINTTKKPTTNEAEDGKLTAKIVAVPPPPAPLLAPTPPIITILPPKPEKVSAQVVAVPGPKVTAQIVAVPNPASMKTRSASPRYVYDGFGRMMIRLPDGSMFDANKTVYIPDE